MSYRLQHYLQIEKELEKKIASLKEDIFGNPMGEVIERRIKFQKMTPEERLKNVDSFCKEDARLMKKAKKQIDNTLNWMDKLIPLEEELRVVKFEIYTIKRNSQ